MVTATLPAPVSVDTVLTLSFGGDLGPNVNYTVSGASYNAATQALTIPAGSTSASILLTGKLDGHYGQPQDTTTVAIAAATGSAFTPAAVTVTFDEADPPPTVTLSPATVTIPENQGTTTITATLSASSDVATTVNLGFTGTAVLGTNYDTLINGVKDAQTLTIPAGDTTASFQIIAKLDGIYGPNLTAYVGINSVQNGVSAGGSATVTITEGDPPPQVTVTPSTSTMAESGGSASFTFALSEISSVDTTLVLGFGGTATLGKDFSVSGQNYSAGTMQLTIPAGQQTAVLTVLGLNNQTFGPNLTATIAIQSVTNGVAPGNPVSTLTITEGDPGPAVALALTGSPIAEIGGQGLVVVSIPAAYTSSVVVNLTFSGTAVLGTNYTVSGVNFVAGPNTLTIPAGTTQSTLVLQAVDDGLYGPNLSVIVSVQSVVNGTYPGGPVTATITNQDPAPSVSLVAANGSLSDNGGQDTITATLSQASGVATTVPFTFAGTAVLGTNFSVVGVSYNPATMSLVIPAGQTSAGIVITGMSQNEHGPNLTITISVAAGGPPVSGSAVSVTIVNSTPPPQIIVNNISLSESASTATFNVLLSQASLLPVTAVYNTVDGTAVGGMDYQSTSGTLTFNPGVTFQTVSVPLLANPLYGPPSKSFGLQVNVTNSGATPSNLEATATVFEDNPTPQITIQGATLAKPTSGQQQLNFTVTLSSASSLVTMVTFATSNITAVAGTDYIATQGVLTFAPGQTTATIPVTILGNATPTGNLSFAVSLSNPTGALLSGPSQAVGTIDDVNPIVGLSVSNTVATVDGPTSTQVDFTVTLFPAMSSQVVTVAVRDGQWHRRRRHGLPRRPGRSHL